jgi:hypothetical protein
MRVETVGATDIGLERRSNKDRVFMSPDAPDTCVHFKCA